MCELCGNVIAYRRPRPVPLVRIGIGTASEPPPIDWAGTITTTLVLDVPRTLTQPALKNLPPVNPEGDGTYGQIRAG